MKTIDDVKNDILEEFNILVEEGEDRNKHVIDLGKELKGLDKKYLTDDYEIRGCLAKVWLYAEYQNGIISFTADSDSDLTKGIIAILIRLFSNRTPDEIINAKLDFIDDLKLESFLTARRSNGLLSMIKQMKLYALAYKTKSQKPE